MNRDINIPNSVHDMNITHLKFYLELVEMSGGKEVGEDFLNSLEPIQVSDLNALFFNEKDGSFDIYNHHSNRQLLNEILISSNRRKANKPKAEIEIDGVIYVLNLDFSKQPVSFHRDLSTVKLKDTPLDIMAFCYIEKGKVYNEVDKSKLVINPRTERAEKFRNKITLAEFLDVQGFFLQLWKALEPYSGQRQREKVKKLSGIGKSQLTT